MGTEGTPTGGALPTLAPHAGARTSVMVPGGHAVGHSMPAQGIAAVEGLRALARRHWLRRGAQVLLWGGLAWAGPVPALAQVPPALGGGAGVHDPRSAIKPLSEREGVVSWSLLSSVTTRVEKARVVPIFPPAVRALHGQKVKVQGFMMPLEPGKPQAHFLLSAVPTTCNFCVPAGAEGLIEVFARPRPVPYSEEAITLEGRLSVLDNDKYGLLYRLDAAVFLP